MRVIAGEFRSRRLATLPGLDVRPTPDRLRETLFNILAAEIPGCVFLDAYAGTGSVGIEALSRGALRAIFLEKQRAAIRVLQENLASLGIQDRGIVVPGPALKNLGQFDAEIVFLDPPYQMEAEYGAALNILSNAPPRIVIAQHTVRLALEEIYGGLARYRELRQGDNVLSFYSSTNGKISK
jgi:16S rRNA (guanine966-N2)-methyltransferase